MEGATLLIFLFKELFLAVQLDTKQAYSKGLRQKKFISSLQATIPGTPLHKTDPGSALTRTPPSLRWPSPASLVPTRTRTATPGVSEALLCRWPESNPRRTSTIRSRRRPRSSCTSSTSSVKRSTARRRRRPLRQVSHLLFRTRLFCHSRHHFLFFFNSFIRIRVTSATFT